MIGAPNEVLGDYQVHIAICHPGCAEHLKLGDRIIFAVAAAAPKRIAGRRPQVGAPILAGVINELHAPIDVPVDRFDPVQLSLSAKRRGVGGRRAMHLHDVVALCLRWRFAAESP